ncbi:hypothetical protein MMARJ_24450 [Mycobacterium marseillense]|uniref:Uncharacterized protein n=1 Tax=Mycobacterium marseillense TaxID=701042 RepID=A0ABM7JCP9_9MYCO|nr:hypothetical protein MMARJ_24450 [Mycobacterium marseillense]
MTSSTRRSAASAKVAACRIRADMTVAGSGVGALLGCPVYGRGVAWRRRDGSREDGRHGATARGTSWVFGS